MDPVRDRYTGVSNIVRFNWHFYAVVAFVSTLAVLLSSQLESWPRYLVYIGLAAVALQTAVSLFVSHLVYDRSELYSLSILEDWIPDEPESVVNIHAGFDETSEILEGKYPDVDLKIWDFYDPARHTEMSIRRARSAYPPSIRQESISTDRLPASDGTVDLVCLSKILRLEIGVERSASREPANDGSPYILHRVSRFPGGLAVRDFGGRIG